VTSLREQIRCLNDRRRAYDMVPPEYDDAAYTAVQAAELDIRATILAARAAQGIPTISLTEAEKLRAVILTGGVVA